MLSPQQGNDDTFGCSTTFLIMLCILGIRGVAVLVWISAEEGGRQPRPVVLPAPCHTPHPPAPGSAAEPGGRQAATVSRLPAQPRSREGGRQPRPDAPLAPGALSNHLGSPSGHAGPANFYPLCVFSPLTEKSRRWLFSEVTLELICETTTHRVVPDREHPVFSVTSLQG
uniref:Uncharacterized protein n=1 Tax=Chelydra serpentina TaxID=8475 RepID=A0A8C3SVA0_CHESE